MEAQLLSESPREASISIRGSDIGVLYAIQHEMLKGPGVEFAGVIVKHPLTNECWMRVSTSKGAPLKEAARAAEAAEAAAGELAAALGSSVKARTA